LIASFTDALTIETSASSHTVSGAISETNSAAESNRIRAVKLTLVASDGEGAGSSALILGGSPQEVDDSAEASARAGSVHAIRGLADSRRRGSEVTSEAFTALSSSVDLLGREGSVVDTARVLTVEGVLSSDDSSDLNQRITDTVSATVTDFSASNTVTSAVLIREVSRVDGFRVKIATSALTEVVRFSIVVVNRVPASSFKETEGDFRDSSSNNTSGGHKIPLEESSSNMGTGIVFHDETGNGVATIVASESVGEGREIEDSSSIAVDGSGFNVVGEVVTIIINKVVVKRPVHTQSVDEFVNDDVEVEIVSKRVGGGISNRYGSSVDTDINDHWSPDARRNGTKGSGSNPGVTSSILTVDKDEDISINTSSEDAGSGETTEGLGSGGDGGGHGVLGLQSSLEIVNNTGNELVLNVISPVVSSGSKKLEIGTDSDVRVGREGSSFRFEEFSFKVISNFRDKGLGDCIQVI